MRKEVTLDSEARWGHSGGLCSQTGLELTPALLPKPHPETVTFSLGALFPLSGCRVTAS